MIEVDLLAGVDFQDISRDPLIRLNVEKLSVPFALTNNNLTRHFVGSLKRIRLAIKEIGSEMEFENADVYRELIRTDYSGPNPVEVCCDPEKLVSLLRKKWVLTRGIKRPKDILLDYVASLDERYLPLAKERVYPLFVGKWEDIKKGLEIVVGQLDEADPEMIMSVRTRLHGSLQPLLVAKDSDRFISAMVDTGFVLKGEGLETIKEYDVALNWPVLMSIFKGRYPKIKAAVESIRVRLKAGRDGKYSKLFVTRKDKVGRKVEVFTDKQLLIDLMAEEGVLLKEKGNRDSESFGAFNLDTAVEYPSLERLDPQVKNEINRAFWNFLEENPESKMSVLDFARKYLLVRDAENDN